MVCPMMLVNTFFDTKLAVGRLGCIFGYGKVRPTGNKATVRFRSEFYVRRVSYWQPQWE
jgi:hypothetical protein